ncbi:MAG: ECF-type sigma factor [Phycisphaerales bacterium]
MDDGSITRLLQDVNTGAPGAGDRLFDRVYAELRAMARARLAHERRDAADGGTTDMVHDAYDRLEGEALENRRHLFFVYARAMRQILVERARRNNALKRGGGRHRISLTLAEPVGATAPRQIDALTVDDLLERLRSTSGREAQVVELRFFGGLSDADIGAILGVSDRTVRNDWSSARERLASWLDD